MAANLIIIASPTAGAQIKAWCGVRHDCIASRANWTADEAAIAKLQSTCAHRDTASHTGSSQQSPPKRALPHAARAMHMPRPSARLSRINLVALDRVPVLFWLMVSWFSTTSSSLGTTAGSLVGLSINQSDASLYARSPCMSCFKSLFLLTRDSNRKQDRAVEADTRNHYSIHVHVRDTLLAIHQSMVTSVQSST